ncbi:prenyltransferase/squalene oxidase repeat-containing protein [Micromonospora sp. NBC_01813]|uniref:prenyltransferase/squalene oxidase repeat-containing protein n=1 Tax=Micromonospora sp. NBC_01813 TaxID=2975988 RepID=UPI002DDC0515|nr:prenyltransferase/squalene oxidase repeat-containing protein [Micromonospora sp. NBC_01813]WSA12841.1 terpene cyclase/mutase family protein [Micromonospora sp. NBC_01813]
MDGAIGFVVAHGDTVDRARLSWLRTGAPPQPDVLASAEIGQAPDGGWPAFWAGEVASVDATCFRLAELDDLGALGRPPARKALDWLVSRQRPDGSWEEDESLAAEAPEWARPGDPEATYYLTANAGYWLSVADADTAAAGAAAHTAGDPAHRDAAQAAARYLAAQMRPDGTWPSYLLAGWLAAATLYRQTMFYESARMQGVLNDRLTTMAPGDVAQLAAALRRAGLADEDWLLVNARRRLTATQRSDGGWDGDPGDSFEVHVALAAIRACR